MRTHGAVVGRRFRSVTKLTTKVRIGGAIYGGVFLLLPQRSKHPREMVITPKASTSTFTHFSHTMHSYLAPTPLTWRLQDILSLQSFYAPVKPPFFAPPHLHYPDHCNSVARLLRNIRIPPDPPCGHTLYTIGNGNIVLRPTLNRHPSFTPFISQCGTPKGNR